MSQSVDKIKFKKSESLIYFFQLGKKQDTISKERGVVFYLIVPDSIKKFISVQTDNGQLKAMKNDSLVKFNYIKGFKYESLFLENEKSSIEKDFVFTTLVNGTSDQSPEKIRIIILDKREKNLLLDNSFIYRFEN